jgi:hypothetical protein
MDKSILQILHCKLLRACSYISFFIPITLIYPFDGCNKNIAPYIKLSFIIKKWHEIFLDDIGSLFAIGHCAGILDHLCNFLQVLENLDAVALVGVLAWFNDPDVLLFLLPMRFGLLGLAFSL